MPAVKLTAARSAPLSHATQAYPGTVTLIGPRWLDGLAVIAHVATATTATTTLQGHHVFRCDDSFRYLWATLHDLSDVLVLLQSLKIARLKLKGDKTEKCYSGSDEFFDA